MAALRKEGGVRVTSDDDMEDNSRERNTEFEEFVEEIISGYQRVLDEIEDCSSFDYLAVIFFQF